MMKKAAMVFPNPLFETPVCSEVDRVLLLEHGQRHDVRLNSLEGFVRQILGWREFMRAVYLLIGRMDKKKRKDHTNLAQRYLETLFR